VRHEARVISVFYSRCVIQLSVKVWGFFLLPWADLKLQNISEILVLKLGLIPHTSLVTTLLIGRTIGLVTVSVDEVHVH